MRIKEKLEDEV